MRIDQFNANQAKPLGVFKPMFTTEKLDVKLSEAKAGRNKSFNHINTDSAETYVVMQGDYNIRVGQPGSDKMVRVEARQGDVFSVPKGVPHGDVTTEKGYRVVLLETPPRGMLDEWIRKFEKAIGG